MTSTYQSYRRLPSLAGVCSMSDAMQPGLSVEECVRRLKRYHYAFKRLHQIFTARITAEPIYELKMGFSLHAHLCAEHVSALRKRVGEMREPPLGLEAVPEAYLELFFDEVQAAPTTEELLLGLYDKALPALKAALNQHLKDTNWLADHPTVRVCRFALLEVEDMLEFGARSLAALVDEACRERCKEWLQLLDDALAAAGGLDGTGGTALEAGRSVPERRSAGFQPAVSQTSSLPTVRSASRLETCDTADWKSALHDGGPGRTALPEPPRTGTPTPKPLTRKHSARPYEYDRVPRRDERFPDPYNMGVNAEAFLYEPTFPPEPKTLMMFYKRLREIDVPEMMASIIAETRGKPWEYYRDLTRQLWDEARHAMMGEVGFANLGVDWPKLVMVNHTWSLALNTQLKPIERHAVLYFIEQGLMPRTGKRFEWEVGQASKNPLAALFQDYDWADEVLHARVGRDWYVKEFDDPQRAVRYGDECWSRVLMNWEDWRRQGLTQHRNWWPELYRTVCQRWGVEPDPRALAYATSYQTVRADLKELTGSA